MAEKSGLSRRLGDPYPSSRQSPVPLLAPTSCSRALSPHRRASVARLFLGAVGRGPLRSRSSRPASRPGLADEDLRRLMLAYLSNLGQQRRRRRQRENQVSLMADDPWSWSGSYDRDGWPPTSDTHRPAAGGSVRKKRKKRTSTGGPRPTASSTTRRLSSSLVSLDEAVDQGYLKRMRSKRARELAKTGTGKLKPRSSR